MTWMTFFLAEMPSAAACASAGTALIPTSDALACVRKSLLEGRLPCLLISDGLPDHPTNSGRSQKLNFAQKRTFLAVLMRVFPGLR